MRRARYRGPRKTHLEHVFAAVGLNLIRLDAWWNKRPLDRTRASHLARLDLSLAAYPGTRSLMAPALGEREALNSVNTATFPGDGD